MKNVLMNKVVFGCIITLICISLNAQQAQTPQSNKTEGYETLKRIEDYRELKSLGYKDHEIFEDLGNASFLANNYKTAVYWYAKLKEISKDHALSSGFEKRYQYAQVQASSTSKFNDLDHENWVSSIEADYKLGAKIQKNALTTSNEGYKPLRSDLNGQNGYEAPIAVTADGKTAYYSKAVYVKPDTGIFSKKELVHRIYKAQKFDGEWKTVKELKVCPKYYSAVHPTVSSDGTRLFFASNMPGTYGEFDIYVVNLYNDGTHGGPKNLGEKVNTKKNELYPNMAGGNTLFFASDGHKGYGGLDVYMTQVDHKHVGLAVNLGSSINSKENDYSIYLGAQKGMGYVMSNRGADRDTIQQVAFSYASVAPYTVEEKREFNILEAINGGSKMDYSSSVFEDQ